QSFAFRLLPRLMVAVLVFLAAVFVLALALDLRVMHRWLEAPELALFSVVRARHGAIFDSDPASGSAAPESCISILGVRRARAPGHPGLYAHRLLCLQGKSRPGRPLPLFPSSWVISPQTSNLQPPSC